MWTDLYQKYNFDYVVEIEKKQEGAEGEGEVLRGSELANDSQC